MLREPVHGVPMAKCQPAKNAANSTRRNFYGHEICKSRARLRVDDAQARADLSAKKILGGASWTFGFSIFGEKMHQLCARARSVEQGTEHRR